VHCLYQYYEINCVFSVVKSDVNMIVNRRHAKPHSLLDANLRQIILHTISPGSGAILRRCLDRKNNCSLSFPRACDFPCACFFGLIKTFNLNCSSVLVRCQTIEAALLGNSPLRAVCSTRIPLSGNPGPGWELESYFTVPAQIY
jgi:hypothetical protein